MGLCGIQLGWLHKMPVKLMKGPRRTYETSWQGIFWLWFKLPNLAVVFLGTVLGFTSTSTTVEILGPFNLLGFLLAK